MSRDSQHSEPGVSPDGSPDFSSDEFVPEDDAIIGTALRWSAVAVVVILVVVGALFWWNRDQQQEEQVQEKDAGEIADLAVPEVVLPRLPFRDVTEECGIDFVHQNGARGGKYLPETMGGGCAFVDFDRDGDQDLLLVDSTSWPWDTEGSPGMPALFRNDGGGHFERARDVGLTESFFGMGVAVGDYDGDGDPDLYLTGVGTNRLYRNDAGKFVDVTVGAGVAGEESEWSTSAGFFDADSDGDLDLFVCNYVHWSREIDEQLAFTLNGQDRAYGPPTNYTGTHPYLFRNNGDGTFQETSEQAGLRIENTATGAPVAKSLGVTFLDPDGDGRLDIFVANDTVQNFLYHNLGECRFAEIGAVSGLGFDGTGRATGAMGIDAAWYRNDRVLGVGIGNFANEMTSLYVADRDPMLFLDDSISEGIGSPSRLALSFALFFFDADLDGRLDLLQTNGHLEESINEVQASQHYRQPAQLFWNAGPEQRSCFTELPADSLADLARPIVGRGAAYADIDADGDLDVVITQVGDRALLLRNDQATGHRWLRCRLVGQAPNHDAIGACVELKSTHGTQRRMVMPTRSYLSQVEMPVTFGLGAEGTVDALRVIWPDGSEQDFDPPAELNQEIVLQRDS